MRACFGVSLLVDIFPELKMCMSGCISDRHERCSFRRCFFVTNGSRLTAWLGRPDFAPCLKALGCIKGASSCSACLRTLGYGWYGHLGTASSFFLFFHFFSGRSFARILFEGPDSAVFEALDQFLFLLASAACMYVQCTELQTGCARRCTQRHGLARMGHCPSTGQVLT